MGPHTPKDPKAPEISHGGIRQIVTYHHPAGGDQMEGALTLTSLRRGDVLMLDGGQTLIFLRRGRSKVGGEGQTLTCPLLGDAPRVEEAPTLTSLLLADVPAPPDRRYCTQWSHRQANLS